MLRLSLRRLKFFDIRYFLKWWRYKNLLRLTSGRLNRISNEKVKEYFGKMISSKNDYHYLILLGKKAIGHVSLMKRKNNWYETQIVIGEKNYWNKGYGTKAIRLLIKKAKRLEIAKIYLEVRPNNVRAIKVYKKCGFQKIGIKNYPDNKYLPKTLKMIYEP